ncbi:MAG: S8 family serine peptidase [Candidatus Hydrogenedentota bacterium]
MHKFKQIITYRLLLITFILSYFIQSTYVITECSAVPYQEGVLLVGIKKTKKGLNLSSLYQPKEVIQTNEISIIKINLLPGEDINTKIKELQTQKGVLFVQPNYKYELKAVPADPLYSEQWYLNNTGQGGGKIGADIKAQNAWDITTGDTTVRIAVLDCGIDTSANDYVSYVSGFDFVDSDNSSTISAGNGTDDDDDGFIDENLHHGTAIASIIGAKGNNSTGLCGIIWNAQIFDIRVFNDDGMSYSDSIACAIRYAVDTNAKVLNLSFGNDAGTYDNTVASAIDYALSKNVILVAAAGNGGGNTIDFPANYSSVIAVGASDRNDLRCAFSDIGPELDIVAPGVDIISYKVGGGTQDQDGTSFSTAMVSAAAGLLYYLNNTLTPSRILTILKNTADDLLPAGIDIYTGAGRLNLYRALKYLSINATTSITSVNYPNPLDFRTYTYTTIESDAITQGALIKLYDIKGREVYTIPSSDIDGTDGKAVWRGINFSNERVSAGIYPYHIKGSRGEAKGFVVVVK